MEKPNGKFCPALWFSGFFGLGAVVHLIRLVLQVPVTIGGWAVPLKFSAAAVLVFGVLSAGLLWSACKRPCCPA